MNDLINLKNQLSEELRKTKRNRDNVLINELCEKINNEKIILNKDFECRRNKKMTEAVTMKQELDRKKISKYKHIRAERKKMSKKISKKDKK